MLCEEAQSAVCLLVYPKMCSVWLRPGLCADYSSFVYRAILCLNNLQYYYLMLAFPFTQIFNRIYCLLCVDLGAHVKSNAL